jgi:putative transcriptional regulator
MSRMGKRLIIAAKEAREIARGEADPKTYRAHLPVEMNVKKSKEEAKVDVSRSSCE